MSDLTALPTPEHVTADFCLVPIGTGSASVSEEVADVQRLVQKSGLKFTMHSAGTTLGTLMRALRKLEDMVFFPLWAYED